MPRRAAPCRAVLGAASAGICLCFRSNTGAKRGAACAWAQPRANVWWTLSLSVLYIFYFYAHFVVDVIVVIVVLFTSATLQNLKSLPPLPQQRQTFPLRSWASSQTSQFVHARACVPTCTARKSVVCVCAYGCSCPTLAVSLNYSIFAFKEAHLCGASVKVRTAKTSVRREPHRSSNLNTVQSVMKFRVSVARDGLLFLAVSLAVVVADCWRPKCVCLLHCNFLKTYWILVTIKTSFEAVDS